MFYNPKNEQGYKAAIKRIDFFKTTGTLFTLEPFHKIRSSKQNAALHLWFTQMADLLNNKGITFESIAGLEAPFTAEYIKVNWFKPIAFAMFEINTTTKLNSNQINQIFDVVSKHLSEMTGEFIEFPSIENYEKTY